MLVTDTELSRHWALRSLRRFGWNEADIPPDMLAHEQEIIVELLKIDPTPDRKYMPMLVRWTRNPRPFDYDSDELAALIATYDRDPSLLIIDRPAPPNMQRISIDAFKEALKRGQYRAAYRADPAAIAARDENYIAAGEVSLLYRDSAYTIYHLHTKEARRAYYAGPDEDYFDSEILAPLHAYQIETPDGKRLTYEDATYTYMRDEVGSFIESRDIRRMFPGFFDIIEPHTCQAVADSDKAKWAIAQRKNRMPEWRDLASAKDATALFRKFYSIERLDERKNRDYVSFNKLAGSLDVIAGFAKAGTLLSGDEVRAFYDLAMKKNTFAAAEQILAIAFRVLGWRAAFSAEEVGPLFDRMHRRDRAESLVHLFVLAAQEKTWCSDREAKYLPQTLAYLAKPRSLPFRGAHGQPPVRADWAKIKIILLGADRCPAWAEQITPAVIATLQHGIDNLRAHHQIDDLLARFKPQNAEKRRIEYPQRLKDIRGGLRPKIRGNWRQPA